MSVQEPRIEHSEPRFERLRLLGAGATGQVELARLLEPWGELEKGSLVAVKTLGRERARSPEARAAFEAEARAGTLVRHPSLVRVLHYGILPGGFLPAGILPGGMLPDGILQEDGTLPGETAAGVVFPAGPLRAVPGKLRAHASTAAAQKTAEAGATDGTPYLLLSYVPGRSLRDSIAEGALPEPQVRSIGAQLAGALAALHSAGLVHGDVKPENVRLDEEGRAILLDLGFASRMHESERTRTAGSLPYLSPERVRGGPSSTAADVFALGVVLYELATGIHPFACVLPSRGSPARLPPGVGSSSQTRVFRRTLEVRGADDLVAAIAAARVEPPSRLAPSLSPFFDQLLASALARASEERPSSLELAQRFAEGESGAWWRGRLSPRPDEESRSQMLSSDWTPLVGRENELERLSEIFERIRSADRRGRTGGRAIGVVWLSGPEGSGKWRLMSEFASRVRASADPPIYLYARWTEAAEARPAGALLVLLHRWLALPMRAEPGRRERELLLELVGERASATLVAALSPSLPSYGSPVESQGGSRAGPPHAAESFDSVPAALARWLNALGRERTVLLFLDDLQHAGLVTLEALSTVLDGLENAALLVVLGLREDAPEAEPALARLEAHLDRLLRSGVVREVAEIALEPLTPEAMLELVNALFEPSVPRGRLAEVLWKRSQGNPGLATEILRDLVARGEAYPASDVGGGGGGGGDGERLLLSIAPDELPLPRSLDRIVAERFDALEPEDQRWCERLAVVGGLIYTDFLARAFPPARPAEIDGVLSRLVRRSWLVPYGDRYRFARPGLREAVYRSIGEAKKRRLHLAAAHGLSSPLSSAPAEELFQRGFHLRAAGENAEVLELALHFLRREERRASAQRLLTLARWGLEALDGLAASDERRRSRLELLEAATDAADRLGHREDQRRLLDYMTDLELDPERFPAEAARLYLLHARYAVGTGQYGLARGMLRNALELAEAAENRSLVSQSCRRMAQVQAQVGEFEEGRRLALRAKKLAQGENQLALAHLALAHLDVLEDRIDSAVNEVNLALRALYRSNEARAGVVAYAHLLRARIWRSAGRPRRAL